MHDSNELPVLFNPPPTVTLIPICLVCMYYVAFHFNHLPHNTLPHTLSLKHTFLHTFLQCTHLLNSHILPPPFFTHTPSLHPHTQNPFIFTPKHPPSSLPHDLLPHYTYLNPNQQELSELHSDELQQLGHSLRSEAESNLSQLRASLEREREEREEEQTRMHKMEIEVERGGKKRKE